MRLMGWRALSISPYVAVFRALGAEFILEPRANPLRAFTHTIAEGEGKAGLRARPSPSVSGTGGGVVTGGIAVRRSKLKHIETRVETAWF